ncbi:MAG: CDP-paratose 2-epimerase [Verrucomicrobiota bacterium]|jgi:CDP-paratose 2-epimerase
MGTKTLLVTGSSGLIGSEVSVYFAQRGWKVHGVDNNQRAVFFGPAGDTLWNRERVSTQLGAAYTHHELDIRDRTGISRLVESVRPAAIIHAAAQPSHDRAAAIPFDDFETNAVGTLNLLEAARHFAKDSPFVFFSTNKVYGDRPNTLALRETVTRWEFSDPVYAGGIAEDFPIDQSMHSLFGASKAAADLLVQEYGRYFGMPTCCLRGGCLTGPNHSGVQLHGFLSFLVRTHLEEKPFTIFGYKGKQVRDNIHSHDVAAFVEAFIQFPRPAEVYNLGGGLRNSCSVLEAIEAIGELTGNPVLHRYDEANRAGDHICYYSNLEKIGRDYPGWEITVSLEDIYRQLIESWRHRLTLEH